MRSALVVPADDQQPLRVEEIETDSLDALQQIPLDRPPASLYVDPDGRLLEKPMNRRATTLLWVHNHDIRGRDVIVGDVLVLGPPDNDGLPINVPEELVDLLTRTSRYRVLVQHVNETQFYGTLRTFGSWFEAYGYAIYLDWLLSQVEEVWVVAEDTDDSSDDEQT
jgi:hypothetical protein